MDRNLSSGSGASGMAKEEGPVAVLAVHGVGRHISGASAEAVADLLLSIGREKGPGQEPSDAASAPPYSGFVSTPIEVPLRRVESSPRLLKPIEFVKPSKLRKVSEPVSRMWAMFDERRGFLAEQRHTAPALPKLHVKPAKEGPRPSERAEKEPDRPQYAYEFLRTQLEDYKGELDRTFSTIRLEARRAPRSPAATVHLYDVHYSDLSKPEKSIAAFFFSFYQLIFHLGSLSLNAVYSAESENANSQTRGYRWIWRVLSSVHATSIRALTMFIPMLNLVLLALGLTAFAEKIPANMSDTSLYWIGAGLFGILGVAGAFLIGRRQPTFHRPFWWALVPLLGLILGGLTGILLSLLAGYWMGPALPRGKVLLVFSWLLAGGALVLWVAGKLTVVRRGAIWVAIIFYALNTLAFLRFLVNTSWHAAEWQISSHEIAVSGLWSIQLIFGELRFLWVLCLVSAALSAILGAVCVGCTTDAGRRVRARAAMRTGRFTFSLSASVFLIVTLALWSGLVMYTTGTLSLFDQVPHSIHVPSVLQSHALCAFIPGIQGVEKWTSGIHNALAQKANWKPAHPWDMYLTGLLLTSLTSGFFVMLVLLSVGLFLLVWAALPSLVFEILPQRSIQPEVTNNRIRWLGNWLSRGLDSTAIITRMAWASIVLVPLLFGSLDFLMRPDGMCQADLRSGLLPLTNWLFKFTFPLSKLSLFMIHGIGVKLAVSGAAIAGFLLKSGTPILDTVLDVDNYLRTSPKEGTPLAGIFERYASLLRYIGGYRDSLGRPYSRLIIVAHSLGSVVSSELLLYMKRSSPAPPDAELAPYGFRPGTARQIPIFLFTMGSPLRQLLNRFFPHRYWWVKDTPDNSSFGNRLPDGVAPPIPAIPRDHLPEPSEAGVSGWVNAYRSGDYIGRSLWIGSWLNRNGVPAPNCALNREGERTNVAGGGNAAETCIGIGAHTHYWDRTAADVATILDRLITNPTDVFG